MNKPVSYEKLKDGLTNLIVESDTHYLVTGSKLDIIVKENQSLELLENVKKSIKSNGGDITFCCNENLFVVEFIIPNF